MAPAGAQLRGGLGGSSVAAWAPAAGQDQLSEREQASPLGKAFTSHQSLMSISTTASSENLLGTSSWSRVITPSRPNSLDGSDAFDEGSRWTPSSDTTPDAADPQDRWLESIPFEFRRPPTMRLGPHRDALRRVPRMHDFRAVYDLDSIGDLDESNTPVFKLGEFRRIPRSLDFCELEGVQEFQLETQAQDLEAP
mmetsp:Transcript_64782/g.175040  ORF Transcript_64782/g.175040 Transcript_64782/m.175040 type:complete len:195 (+) Transcript_64782:61-645(+)